MRWQKPRRQEVKVCGASAKKWRMEDGGGGAGYLKGLTEWRKVREDTQLSGRATDSL